MADRPLTMKQQKFVDEYLRTRNVTRSAVIAGYGNHKKSAEAIGQETLENPRIQEMIAQRRQELAQIVHMTQEKWIRRIEWLSRANISRIMEWDETGVKVKPSQEMSEQETWLISEIDERKGKYGNSIRIKLTDKLAALAELGKALGYYPDKKKEGDTYNQYNLNLQQSTDPIDLSALTADEKAQFRALLSKMSVKVIGEGKA
ncbi:MAG: terminase small subunit [Nitrospirales bacterium]|nr:terminase small subunit [Nitrospirales bacterium]